MESRIGSLPNGFKINTVSRQRRKQQRKIKAMRNKAVLVSLVILDVVPMVVAACSSGTELRHSASPSPSSSIEPMPSICGSVGCPINYDTPKTNTEEQESKALPTPKNSCPEGMVEVEGDYCPNVEEICLFNVDVDGHKLNTPTSNLWSCGEYKYPTKCLSPQKDIKHLHFYIDRYEFPNKEGEVPRNWMSWYDAKNACEGEGKRLCTSEEWTLAAEGPNHNPLPYGDGYHRDSSICNFDRHMPNNLNVFNAKKPDDETSRWLRTFIVPSGSKPDCQSFYGVHDLSGNVDEWVYDPKGSYHSAAYVSNLRGGHWWHVRNNSRGRTVSHSPSFNWYECGSRCCSDPKPSIQ